MDSASTSDKPDASAVTYDNHPDGRFSYRECYSPLPQPEGLPSKIRQGKVNMPLGKERSTLLVRTESCITSVSRVSVHTFVSSGRYMYSNLN